MVFFDLVFGLLLVFAGRNLFWLCVGIVGFLVGVQCAEMLGLPDSWMELLMALSLGCLGAALTVSFEWFMLIFGMGFLGGGYLLMRIFPSEAQQDPHVWLVFVVGGIVGMCLMVIALDWTMIMISSLLGAMLIVSAVFGPPPFRDILFVISMTIGIVVQYLTLRGTPQEGRSAVGG